jgi:hypothetical protein
MEDWLAEYSKERTRITYRNNFSNFLEWTGKTPKQLVEEFNQQKTRSLILTYQNHLMTKYKPNTARALINTARAFYTSQCEPVRKLKRRIVATRAAKGEHTFSVGDLRLIREVGDFRDKAMISVAASLGWEASAFLNLDRDFIEKLVNRAKSQNEDFIAFDWLRQKTQSEQFGILTPTALHDLENYLNATKDNPTQKLFDITPQGLNKWLKSQVQKANIVTTGDVRFHLVRKWLMSSLSDAGLNAFEIKLILGKSIPVTDSTYLQTLKKSALEKVKKAYPKFLSLVHYHNGAIKINETVKLAIDYMKLQEQLRQHLKEQGLLKHIPPQLEKQFEQTMNLLIEIEEKAKPKKEGKKVESEAQKDS